ncbi:sensor histidine kinase [Verticiella sediminum]|uniref:histidine kinase n=1 Tax=Verticiella sediminum TaxID=1247510 RepID=A0A556A6M0_9BURK|nr:sensor histidine kinase [Verticiella sediminum]
MLMPLLLLWPLAISLTYFGAADAADAPYDRALASTLLLLTQQVRIVDGAPAVAASAAAEAVLRGDETDTMFYLVQLGSDPPLAGDPDLPLPAFMDRPLPGVIQYRDAVVRGFPVRVAFTWVDLRLGNAPPVLVQVAETLEKRAQLANLIVRSVVAPQLVILPLAVLMVWLGLARGIAPLNELQARLRQRKPDDLSPIATRQVPQEILPLVHGMNDLLVRLAANVEAQRRFVADAAHQLKTPLAGIRTQSELAQRTDNPVELHASLTRLVEGSERATRLVNQLLALARAEGGPVPELADAPVDLAELAREQTLARVPQAIAAGVDLGWEEDDQDEPAWVVGNALLLDELILNLVDNALRYTPAGGSVTVRAYRRGDCCILEVDDSGPGIPADERERVFDRFYRVLGHTAEGSGLGLAIVREIAQRHRGTVSLSDNPLRHDAPTPGTRVAVELPAAPSAPPVAAY